MSDTVTDRAALDAQERVDLEAIRVRSEAATPGPWRWNVHPLSRMVSLLARRRMGETVMDFVRWGTSSAAPRFRHMDGGPDDGLMSRVEHFAEIEPGREHHADWHRLLAHPDAEFIAHAREDVPALIAEVERLRAALARPAEPAEGWRPIAEAPKDGSEVVLWLPYRRRVAVGRWNEDRYAKKPRGYWQDDTELLWGKLRVRSDQPTHWMPLPEAPK